MGNPIACFYDLCGEVGSLIYEDDAERTEGSLKKAIYKGTACGAWVCKEQSGVAVGSIVEGAEQCTDVYRFHYPFDSEEFWKALEDVEQQADEIWKDTHGCEDCWPDGHLEWDGREFGCWPINPDCKVCKGEGVIL